MLSKSFQGHYYCHVGQVDLIRMLKFINIRTEEGKTIASSHTLLNSSYFSTPVKEKALSAKKKILSSKFDLEANPTANDQQHKVSKFVWTPDL